MQENGAGGVIRISADNPGAKSTTAPDNWLLSIYVADGIRPGVFELPSSQVQIAYSSCKRKFFRSAPCFVGDKARGQVSLARGNAGQTLLQFDLTVQGEDWGIARGAEEQWPPQSIRVQHSFEIDPVGFRLPE